MTTAHLPASRVAERCNILLTGAALLSLAVLLAWFSTRYNYHGDWTRSGRHTLSAASRQLLEQLQGPVEITAYARDQEALREAIRRFVGRYQRLKPDLALQFINPDAVPDDVRNLGISINGEMVLRYQGRLEHVRGGSEQEFTNALQRLLRGRERWLAFLEGHGERAPLGDAAHDLRDWARQLSSRGFRYQPINLARIRTIPDNTKVLVLSVPRIDLMPGETQLVLDYLAAGGNLLWLSDPAPLQGLEAVADYLGIEFPPGTVVDTGAMTFGIDDPTITLASAGEYQDHPLLARFDYSTLFPGTAAVSIRDGADGWTARPLVRTGAHTWLETGPLQGPPELDTASDIPGPVTVALALERRLPGAGAAGQKQQRVVVTGDGDFLSNTYLASSGNLELGLRMVNWLSGDEDFLTIPATTAADTDLNLSPVASGIIGLGFLALLPLGLLCCGALVWWRRRNL